MDRLRVQDFGHRNRSFPWFYFATSRWKKGLLPPLTYDAEIPPYFQMRVALLRRMVFNILRIVLNNFDYLHPPDLSVLMW